MVVHMTPKIMTLATAYYQENHTLPYYGEKNCLLGRKLKRDILHEDSSAKTIHHVFLQVPFVPSKLWVPFVPAYPQEKLCQLINNMDCNADNITKQLYSEEI